MEVLDFLRSFHRKAPFLFYNGNTFAAIGRALMDVLFVELPTSRRRTVVSAVAHYIAGVLDREAMIETVESLFQAAHFQVGDPVQTLKGTTRGTITRILEDGRVAWRVEGSPMEGSPMELIALPESLRCPPN